MSLSNRNGYWYSQQHGWISQALYQVKEAVGVYIPYDLI